MSDQTWQDAKKLFHEVVDLAPAERAAFLLENCRDEILRREVEELLFYYEKSDEFIKEPAVVEAGFISSDQAEVGEKIEDYQILREIGRGGMGTVYLAVRAGDELKQRVALKIVKRGMDTDFIVRRFRNERQILAGLNHPNIARLLEGGTTRDGLPYFVMEYVDGQDLISFCLQKDLSVEKRLNLFQQVCAAVSYAHQNLVVHRDLKPSNILVTKEGAPKLLDFGIAKILSADGSDAADAKTTGLFRLLTPEYASPEQIRGGRVTTASDVYSLGVLLYEILTGTSPYQTKSKNYDEVVRAVCETEPVKPSEATAYKSVKTRKNDIRKSGPGIPNPKSLRGDLDNIVIKALQKDPARRYQSVQEFSADVRRHLDGLPVTAQADTFGYRAAKFVRRHQAGVFAGLLIFLSLLGGIGATGWQAYRANVERVKAEHRFNQVRKLANTVLFDYHDGVQKLAGSTPIREKMVRDALEYLDNLSAESGNDTDLQRELAAAYHKVAEVQGAPYRANLGNSKGALESYQKALAIREKLNSETAAEAQIKIELIQSYIAVGELSQVVGKIREALESYRKAFAVFDSLPVETAEAKRELAVLHRHYAKALAPSGELASAIEGFRKSIAISNELLAANPDDRVSRRDVAFAHVFLGDALVNSGDLSGALAAERAAYGLFESLIEPTDAQSRREANVAYARIARVLGKMGNYKEALEIEQKALAIDEQLLQADPSNVLARRDVYIDYYKVAQAQAAIGDLKSAVANLRKSVTLCEAEIALNPLNSELRGDLVAFYYNLGAALEKDGKLAEAFESYKKVATIQEALANEDPSNALQRGNLSEIMTKVSDLSLKFGNKAEAFEGYQKALAIREELVRTNPENADSRMQLAFIYKGLGEYFSARAAGEKSAADWQEAKRRFQQSLDIWTELRQKGPLEAGAEKEPDDLKQKIRKCEANLK